MPAWSSRLALPGWYEKKASHSRKNREISFMLTVWLLLVWVMAFGEFTPVTVISGIAVACLVQWVFPLPRMRSRWVLRPVPLVYLCVRFLGDLIWAGLQVSWLVLRRPPVKNAIVRVHLRSNDPVHLTIVAAMTSLVPGSIVVRVNILTGVLYLHVFDIESHGGSEGVRKSTRALEKRVLYACMPDSELRQLGIDRRRIRRVGHGRKEGQL